MFTLIKKGLRPYTLTVGGRCEGEAARCTNDDLRRTGGGERSNDTCDGEQPDYCRCHPNQSCFSIAECPYVSCGACAWDDIKQSWYCSNSNSPYCCDSQNCASGMDCRQTFSQECVDVREGICTRSSGEPNVCDEDTDCLYGKHCTWTRS